MRVTKDLAAWISWLDACNLPADHIATVLDIESSQVATWLARIPRRTTDAEAARVFEMRAAGQSGRAIGRELGRSHSAVYVILNRGSGSKQVSVGPPQVCRRAKNLAVRGQSGTKIRHLAALDYPQSRIAEIMRLRPEIIADFLKRLTSSDGDRHLRKARSTREQRQLERNRLRAEMKPPKPVKPPTWQRSNARLDTAGWTPPSTEELPAIAAAELVVHQAVDELLPTRPATENPPADGPAWGHHQHRFAAGERHGRSKLTRANVDEARELRAAGWSTGRLAERYGVSRNTICYALNGKTWQDA
jgi:hypothetical protein